MKKAAGLLNKLLFGLNIAFVLFFFFKMRLVEGASPPQWTAPDVVVTVLTALAVMLAVVTIFIAALAIFGYQAMKEMVRDVAQATAAREVQALKAPSIAQRGTGARDLALALQEENGNDAAQKPPPKSAGEPKRSAAKAPSKGAGGRKRAGV